MIGNTFNKPFIYHHGYACILRNVGNVCRCVRVCVYIYKRGRKTCNSTFIYKASKLYSLNNSYIVVPLIVINTFLIRYKY